MSEATSQSRESANRIGQHLKLSFTNYLDHWQEWITPTLVAAAITIAAIFCCFLPYFFVLGPVSCGLYCCALTALRGNSASFADFKRGWQKIGSSTVAWFFISVGSALPALLMYGFFFGLFAIIIALAPTEPSRSRLGDPGDEFAVAEEPVEIVDEVDGDEVSPEFDAEAYRTEGDLTSTSDEARGMDDSTRERPEEPPAAMVLLMIVFMFFFYAMLFLFILFAWVWALWFGTRTMFVLPLIADRHYGFVAAVKTSWRETQTRFWELLLLNFLAGFIGAMGLYAMYVGVLFTLPIAFTIIAAVYEERFPREEKLEQKPAPSE